MSFGETDKDPNKIRKYVFFPKGLSVILFGILRSTTGVGG